MEYKDYYDILGVKKNAQQDEIKRSYRKLARKYHPDVSKESNAEARFKELNEAYEVLKDPEKRAAYNHLGANWQAGQEFKPPPNWDANFEFSGGGFTSDGGGFSDFFESLFGHHGRPGFNFGATRHNFRTGGQDQHARIFVDLEDSLHGATRTITLQSADIDKQGRVVTKPHTIKVKIPRGIKQNQQIRLRGQGSDNVHGQKGDLYLEIAFNPHPIYRTKGADLEFDLPLTPWEAALGATIKVPTPSGTVDLKIPPNSKAGSKLRLKSRGIPGQNQIQNGDLYALLKIVLPPAKSKQAKAFYRKMEHELSFNPRANLGV